MKNIALAAVLLLMTTICFCQSQTNALLTIEADTLNLKGNSDKWTTHVNSTGAQTNALISFADKDRVYYFLVDPSLQLIGKYSVDKDAMPANYYGPNYNIVLQISDNTSFKNYVHGKKDNKIIVEHVDLNQGTSSTADFLQFGKKEKFLTAFEDNHHLYFITLPAKSHKLHVYVDSLEVAKEIELKIEDSLMHINLEKNLNDIMIIKNSKEPDLYSCKSLTKLYVQGNGEVVLTIDSNFQFTALFKIDLNNFTSKSKFIRKSFFYCNDNEYASDLKSNSFVYKDKILQGVFCRNDMLMQLKDISTDSIVTELHASRDSSSIDFASSNLIKREESKKKTIGIVALIESDFRFESNVRKEKEKELKTGSFFRAVNNSYFTFLIVQQGEFMILKIGEAHDAVQSNGVSVSAGPIGGVHPVGGGFTPFGKASAAGLPSNQFTYFYTAGPTYRREVVGEIETYFKTIFKSGFSEFVPSTDIETKYDKVDHAIDKLKDVIVSEAAFEFNQRTCLFYLDKKKKKFVIEQIE